MQIQIRTEQPEDREAVYEINRQAFGREDESRLIELLRKSSSFIPELSLVALMREGTSAGEGRLAGHILFTENRIVTSAGESHVSLSLAPMAVLPQFQNQGVGSQLVREGLRRAQELGYASVIVLGHEDYYPRFGFEPASKWNIGTHYDVPQNVFMALELVENGLSGISGTVEYPEEFAMI